MKIPRNKRRIWNAAAAYVVHQRALARERHIDKPSHYPPLHRAVIALRFGAKGTFEVL